MTNKHIGWALFIAGLAMMLGLMSVEVATLQATGWKGASEPIFVAKVMAHFSSTLMAFVGGKLIPTPQDQREDDKKDG